MESPTFASISGPGVRPLMRIMDLLWSPGSAKSRVMLRTYLRSVGLSDILNPFTSNCSGGASLRNDSLDGVSVGTLGSRSEVVGCTDAPGSTEAAEEGDCCHGCSSAR